MADRTVWTIPNVITMSRIALVPVFAVALAHGDHLGPRLLALGVFVLASATDKLDGWLARRTGTVSDLGKMLDPIADKALTGTALVMLSATGVLPWWITVLILVRELGITVLRFFLLKYLVLPASRGGKLKTVLQIVGISLFLLPLASLPVVVTWLAWLVMLAALVVTLVTGVEYLLVAARVRREAKAGT